MDRNRMRRVAFVESVAVGALGALVGVAGYAVVNHFLGPSGLMGFTWYPRASSLSPTAGVILVAAVGLVAGSGGGRAVGRAAGDPVRSRFDGAEPAVRWWSVIPFVLGVTVLAEIVLTGHHMGTVSGRVLAVVRPVLSTRLIGRAGIMAVVVGTLLLRRPRHVGARRLVGAHAAARRGAGRSASGIGRLRRRRVTEAE